MKLVKRDNVYSEHSRENKPGLVVMPGEEFAAETELCTGDWLQSIEDRWTPEKSKGCNPAVCVYVEGAEPGDVLAVKIIDIKVDDLGYTGFNGYHNKIGQQIYPKDWGINTRTVRIRDGFVEWSKQLRLPVRPMIGTLGTAPQSGAVLNSYGGRHGGNMDVQEVTSGNTVYLPVFVPGALLHIGDVHAIQGDGEINVGGGIECRSTVRLVVDLIKKPDGMEWIRIENDDYIMTVACCDTVEKSFFAAAGEILRWMVKDYGFTEEEAYLLMGQVMEARCTQFVNPTRTYICKMPKKFLIPKTDF
jgi:amidase